MNFEIRALAKSDLEALAEFLRERWNSEKIVARGTVYRTTELAGFVAQAGDGWIGVATTVAHNGRVCELLTLDSLRPGAGIGTALFHAVRDSAAAGGFCRLVVITTNDNTPALRFYQRRGMRIVAVHVDAVTRARALKPEIPLRGVDDIPICDEIELEMPLF